MAWQASHTKRGRLSPGGTFRETGAPQLLQKFMARFPSPGLCHRSTGVDKLVERFFAPCPRGLEGVLAAELEELGARDLNSAASTPDRKSTRLNSSHLVISYAVFCLKKKKR